MVIEKHTAYSRCVLSSVLLKEEVAFVLNNTDDKRRRELLQLLFT